ncbi:MAG: hypothetical protein U9P14_11110, partial [Gemmatimonadota bacterium]|nr:hypothetical protein [Gemmatimonadota bacterium]
MKGKLVGMAFIAAVCVFSAARAGQYSVKIVSSAQPDCWSLEEMVKEVIAGKDSDREKALALHNFGMAHQIHFIGPMEGDDYLDDALKLLGVYGYNLCGNNSTAMCALYNLAGLEARRRFLKGHVVPEVRFEGRWNYIDTDMYGYVVKPGDLAIASVDDLIENPGLFARGRLNPDPFFPFDKMEAMQRSVTGAGGLKDYHPYSNAHLMRLQLREHESVTCYYRPRGRFYLSPAIVPHKMSTMYRKYWIDGPVRTNTLAWTDTVPASYGNAVFEYEPDLRSRTFSLENPQIEGVRVQGGDELPPLVSAVKGKKASVVIEVASPWVIAGLQNDITDFEDNSDGAVISGWFWRMEEEDENRILVSLDGGRSWEKVWENTHLGAVPFHVDVTALVQGRYGYLVKFEWTGNGGTGQMGLEGLRLTTWAELSPMALPRLETGLNKMSITTSSHRAFLSESRWHQGLSLWNEERENLTENDNEKHPRLYPLDPQTPGVLIFSPGAEGILDELRISITAYALKDGNPGDVQVALSMSENKGSTWTGLEKFTVHPEHGQDWMNFNHVVTGRSLDGNRTRIRIEVTGGGLDKVTANSLVRVV